MKRKLPPLTTAIADAFGADVDAFQRAHADEIAAAERRNSLSKGALSGPNWEAGLHLCAGHVTNKKTGVVIGLSAAKMIKMALYDAYGIISEPTTGHGHGSQHNYGVSLETTANHPALANQRDPFCEISDAEVAADEVRRRAKLAETNRYDHETVRITMMMAQANDTTEPSEHTGPEPSERTKERRRYEARIAREAGQLEFADVEFLESKKKVSAWDRGWESGEIMRTMQDRASVDAVAPISKPRKRSILGRLVDRIVARAAAAKQIAFRGRGFDQPRTDTEATRSPERPTPTRSRKLPLPLPLASEPRTGVPVWHMQRHAAVLAGAGA